VPAEACEHVINVSFNKSGVPGCPILVQVSGNASGPQVSLNGPGPVHQPNSLIITHPGGRLDDVEVNVEGEFDEVENCLVNFVNREKVVNLSSRVSSPCIPFIF
jgi:hypothetical protein